MRDILHVAPVMPVDEHHIEYALDRMKAPGRLVTSWLPAPLENGVIRAIPALKKRIRREPVRLHTRVLERAIWPDLRRAFELLTLATETTLQAHDRFFDAVDKRCAAQVTEEVSAVVAREFGALQSFRRAKSTGSAKIYHLPTTHHQRLKQILAAEKEAYPDVCLSTFDAWEFEPARVQRKAEEIALADRIICPSTFVRDTLLEASVEERKISVIPFGAESSWLEAKRQPSSKTFLFVGNISARKGAHRLLKAWKALGAWHSHHLLLVGDMHLAPSFLRDYAGMYEHRPKMGRDELRDLYLSADALILPALAEGFALVILEALSCGTPVLASHNSGAAGFLKPDTEGKLFPAQDDEALAAALEWALTEPSALAAMGQAGRQRAAAWPWLQFQNQVIELIRQLTTAP